MVRFKSQLPIDRILKQIVTSKLWQASLLPSIDGNVRTAYRAYINDINPRTDKLIYNEVGELVKAYCTMFPECVITGDEGYTLTRYLQGEKIDYHADSGLAEPRVASFVLYLNDDFKGGETHFDKLGIKVKPQKGTGILFPADYAFTHSSLPVKSGIKYSLVTWFKGHTEGVTALTTRYKEEIDEDYQRRVNASK